MAAHRSALGRVPLWAATGLLGVAFDTFCWVATGLRSAGAQDEELSWMDSGFNRALGVIPW